MAITQPKGDEASNRSMSSYYEGVLIDEVLETHDDYDKLAFPLKPVLDIIELIFGGATAEFPGVIQGLLSQEDGDDHKAVYSGPHDRLELPRVTTAISDMIFCDWLDGGDAHKTTMDILHMIKHYNWDAKLVLVVAAFAMNFGGFRLVAQLHFTNPLAKAVALLKKLPEMLEFSGNMKPKLKVLFVLIKAILDMVKTIVELCELFCKEDFTAESPEVIATSSADVAIAVYWTIRGTVDCASQFVGLIGIGPNYLLLETWDVASLAHKLEKIRSQLVHQINVCYRFIEKKKDDEILDGIARVLESSHIDNSKSLNILFHENGHQQALFDCLHQNLVSIKDLRGKVVGLYITDLDIVTEDYLILQQMYPEMLDDQRRIEYQYEIVWVPVVDHWTNRKDRQFESLRDQMEWLSVNRPSEIASQVIRYFRERCNFVKKPILVVMDTEGKIVHKDAIQMFCIWGNQAYPFSLDKETSLWQKMSWTVSLLAEGIDQYLPDWIQEGKHICLYGGEDIEWIRKFTRTAKGVALGSGIDLEMLYVGKDRARERVVRKIANAIQREKLSKVLGWKLISYFWLRMEKMCISEPPEGITEELTKSELFVPTDPVFAAMTDETMPDFSLPNDRVFSAQTYNPIFSGIIKILSFGSSSKGWAAISGGSENPLLFEADGEALLKALTEHEKWKQSAENYGFVTALAR
ncbi:protein SIEVE ELEMENT OCCLUSION B isoform X2 [Morus notabilis]|nr:protein SIEVE ELEMENT OCCLUSION B isoform X2 [Morus notabilis]